MPSEKTTNRYRYWYAKLLRLYARPYRERFAESIEQTFHDVCRERAAAGKRLLPFVIWAFVETSASIVRENARCSMSLQKSVVRVGVGTLLFLLIPLLGNMFVAGWNWDLFDFVVIGAVLFATGLTYDLVAGRGGTTAYRAAVAISCLTGLILFWVNAAVGIIGDDGPANTMYLAVLVLGFIAALLVRFEPRRMSRVLFAMAVAQAIVPLIAMTWVPEERFDPGYVPVVCLNAVFVALWCAAGWLFRHAANPRPNFPRQATTGSAG